MTMAELIQKLMSHPLYQGGEAANTEIKLVLEHGVFNVRRVGVITSPLDSQTALALFADD